MTGGTLHVSSNIHDSLSHAVTGASGRKAGLGGIKSEINQVEAFAYVY